MEVPHFPFCLFWLVFSTIMKSVLQKFTQNVIKKKKKKREYYSLHWEIPNVYIQLGYYFLMTVRLIWTPAAFCLVVHSVNHFFSHSLRLMIYGYF